jgi:hypothetical protein
MNITKTTSGWLLALILAAGAAVCARAEKQPATTNAPQIRSVFVIPTNSKEGRDPFFPESTRLASTLAPTNHAPEVTSLKVPGISRAGGQLLAIINNHTFAVGDEGDVLTDSGRIHLRCVDIQADAVIVEVNGQTHKLKLQAQ